MRKLNFHRSLIATAVATALGSGAAWGAIEELIVTAQKRSESVQDVPIAITAFSEDDMKAKQIVGFADMRFTAPAVTFTKGNFTGTNMKIRGIGTDLVAASSDNGVGIHVNEVPLINPRLFETEFYDVEQLLVLRGPQGTLYGRNSTGGAINMATRTAVLDEFSGDVEAQLGNYQHRKVNGAINIPVGDTLAIRLAGIYLKRDGYTKNLYTGKDIDDRDQYSVRGSIRWAPSENTTVDLMASWFDEDDTRTRSQKQMCHQDPTALLGCLPDKLAYEIPHASSQLGNILASTAVLGPFGIHEFLTTPPNTNPHDMRKVYSDRDPVYKTDETLVTLHLKHEWEHYTLDAVAGYQDTALLSQMDYLLNVGGTFTLPAALPFVLPNTYAALYSDGLIPMSAPSSTATGVIGGHVDSRLNRLEAFDQSDSQSEQQSIELRISSQLDGPFNFTAGVFYMKSEADFNYWVLANGLDYGAVILGGLLAGDGVAWAAPNYSNDTSKYDLESKAVFGEVYYDLSDSLKLTLGARYTIDKKEIQDVQYLFNSDANGIPLFRAIGDDSPIPVTPRDDDNEWKEWTGRAVLDWTISDTSMAYLSYSRGYKGGGFNPAFNAAEFPSQKPDFDPEFIDSFEIGLKNSLFDNTVQANFSAYYYDYQGLQVSKIVNRTSFNENTDAEMYGLEGEFLFAPNDEWVINSSIAFEHTEIKDFSSVDGRDPTNGDPNVTLLKDLSNASNCIALMPQSYFTGVLGLSQYTSCSALAAAGIPISDGVAADLDGNELQLTPDLKFVLGVQRTWTLPQDYSLALRVDYYWQSDMWGRNYNRDPIDKIESWDVWNAQASLTSPDENWYVRAYIKNILDKDRVTGMYITDPSSGLFTNVFTIEPRTYGLTLGYKF